MKAIIIEVIFLIVLSIGQIGVAADSDYFKELPIKLYSIKNNTYNFKDLTIEINQAKRITESEETANLPYCKAEIIIKNNGNIISQKNYKDIWPVGGWYGLFVPTQQPSKEFFIVIKEGDYDGRIMLIDKSGNINDYPGGIYFISKDRKYIISNYDSDDSGVTVIDANSGKRIFTETGYEDSPYEWYECNNNYYFSISEWPEHQSIPIEKKNVICKIDIQNRKVVKEQVMIAFFKSLKTIKFDFEPKE